MSWTRISNDADFRNLAVYRHDGPEGVVARIAFRHREFVKDWRTTVGGFAVIAAAVMFPMGFVLPLPRWLFGFPWAVLSFVTMFVVYRLFRQPGWVKRSIELDFGKDALRVLRGKKIEVQRQLSRLSNLTVDPHPEAELTRAERMAKNERNPRPLEITHCLFGWFGAGGSERVALVSRAEWPPQNSLFEVRQAILWTVEQISGSGPLEVEPEEASERRGGIAPPLD